MPLNGLAGGGRAGGRLAGTVVGVETYTWQRAARLGNSTFYDRLCILCTDGQLPRQAVQYSLRHAMQSNQRIDTQEMWRRNAARSR